VPPSRSGRSRRRFDLDLVRFEATDGLALSGLLYGPRRSSGDAALFLHGNGDSSIFTSARRTNVIGAALAEAGIAFLPFDNRGAHMLKWMKRRVGRERESVDGGMAFETIRDCAHDIDGAMRFLRRQGFRRIHLIGHSTGANKVALYHWLKPRNRASRYVLLAPGDDTGIYYRALGAERFRKAIDRCRAEVALGRGNRLAPKSWSPFRISFASFLDTIDPDGDYNVFPFHEAMFGPRLSRRKRPFREFRSITRPTLVVYGDGDEFCWGDVPGCVEILRKHAARPRRLETYILPDTDHGFHGKERELGELIATFLRE